MKTVIVSRANKERGLGFNKVIIPVLVTAGYVGINLLESCTPEPGAIVTLNSKDVGTLPPDALQKITSYQAAFIKETKVKGNQQEGLIYQENSVVIARDKNNSVELGLVRAVDKNNQQYYFAQFESVTGEGEKAIRSYPIITSFSEDEATGEPKMILGILTKEEGKNQVILYPLIQNVFADMQFDNNGQPLYKNATLLRRIFSNPATGVTVVLPNKTGTNSPNPFFEELIGNIIDWDAKPVGAAPAETLTPTQTPLPPTPGSPTAIPPTEIPPTPTEAAAGTLTAKDLNTDWQNMEKVKANIKDFGLLNSHDYKSQILKFYSNKETPQIPLDAEVIDWTYFYDKTNVDQYGVNNPFSVGQRGLFTNITKRGMIILDLGITNIGDEQYRFSTFVVKNSDGTFGVVIYLIPEQIFSKYTSVWSWFIGQNTNRIIVPSLPSSSPNACRVDSFGKGYCDFITNKGIEKTNKQLQDWANKDVVPLDLPPLVPGNKSVN